MIIVLKPPLFAHCQKPTNQTEDATFTFINGAKHSDKTTIKSCLIDKTLQANYTIMTDKVDEQQILPHTHHLKFEPIRAKPFLCDKVCEVTHEESSVQ